MKAPPGAAHESDSEGAIRRGCGGGSGPNTHVSNYVYLGTGAKGVTLPKAKLKPNHWLFAAVSTMGVWGVTPSPPTQPNRCRVWRRMWHRKPKTAAKTGEKPSTGGHNQCAVSGGALNQTGLSDNQLQGGRQKREVFQPHRTNAGHYRVGQPNQAFSFGKGKRAAPPPAARGCSNHGGRGVTPTLPPT